MSSEAKFAPGPWYVGGNGQDILWFDDGLDRCTIVATVAGYVQSEGIVPHGSGTASLIAAAPELLEACKAALAYDRSAKSSDLQRDHDKRVEIAALLEMAIAKAAPPNRPTP